MVEIYKEMLIKRTLDKWDSVKPLIEQTFSEYNDARAVLNIMQGMARLDKQLAVEDRERYLGLLEKIDSYMTDSAKVLLDLQSTTNAIRSIMREHQIDPQEGKNVHDIKEF